MAIPQLKAYKKLSFLLFGVASIMVLFVIILTYIHGDKTSANPFIFWTIEHHFEITVTLMIFSVILGYAMSTAIYQELMKSRKGSKKLMDMLYVFLNKEERSILVHLVEKKGGAKQSEIALLPGMNRVKAFRCLQKMKENNLIDIEAHGKIRKVILKEDVLNSLMQTGG